jgi:hypothetical protein
VSWAGLRWSIARVFHSSVLVFAVLIIIGVALGLVAKDSDETEEDKTQAATQAETS